MPLAGNVLYKVPQVAEEQCGGMEQAGRASEHATHVAAARGYPSICAMLARRHSLRLVSLSFTDSQEARVSSSGTASRVSSYCSYFTSHREVVYSPTKKGCRVG
jgi:hypothetical protein